MLLKTLSIKSIKVGIRKSALSLAQLCEVQQRIAKYFKIELIPVEIETGGDLDQTTSLRNLDKTDFFTKEIEVAQKEGICRLSIHSAKDLPEALSPGLKTIALTPSIDPSDVLVYRDALFNGCTVATSSLRREKMVIALGINCRFVDVRGSVVERLAFLDRGVFDGLVVAKAALIRLKLLEKRKYLQLQGDFAPLQGSLAIVAKDGDLEMEKLFNLLRNQDRWLEAVL
jgi:hydroxymethylbilane synthase